LCLLLAAPAQAQTAGVLRGLVTDARGTPLGGVVITVASRSQGAGGRGAVTDRAGLFQVLGLPPAGDYSVRASLPGFATVTLSDVMVAAGAASAVGIILPPESALRQRVEVRASPSIVNPDETATETRITSEFITALPILGRDYQDALTLAPGVTDVDGDGNPNIHGARDTDVITLVDGVNTTDPLTGKIGAQLNIESIQEIEIKTAGASAEFGRAQGGFANIVTKSGGNKFEGAFKMFWRGSALDRGGAGIDDPRLHAGVGEAGLRDLRFNDFLPFLSLGGPIVEDHAWFYVANEHIQNEDPVNALNTAFVRGTREYREFAKLTWQVAANHRLALSLNYDPQDYLNQGLNSFTREETGYTTRAGGTVLTLKGTSVLSPMTALETSVSRFDGRPALVPNISRDTNHNGIYFYDRNRNGFADASERDPGEDYDQDGKFDVFEDKNHNGVLDPGEDLDGDGHLTPPLACEASGREDTDCDGRLDNVDEDVNGNGVFDFYPYNEDIDHDFYFDRGTEDRNGNGVLDDTPRPSSLYPYGHLKPTPPDRDYTIGQTIGIISGPYFKEYADHHARFTFRQDLSVYVPGARGSHDLKAGFIVEREGFRRRTKAGEITATIDDKCTGAGTSRGIHPGASGEADVGDPCPSSSSVSPGAPTIKTLLPVEPLVDNSASALDSGLYVQDNFKPRANVSIGLGLRFDRELTDSFGYSFFDPAPERAPFDRLNALIGSEVGLSDFLQGNNDGLENYGILGDPIFQGRGDVKQNIASIADPIRVAAIARLTRHHSQNLFLSGLLGSLYPEIFGTGSLDLEKLRNLGVVTQQPEKFRLTNNNLSPRLSVSWDPRADGRTKLFATWGRYYDKLFLNTIVGEEGPDYLARYYLFDPTGLTFRYSDYQIGGHPLALGATPDHYIGRMLAQSAPSTTQVDRGLRTPFSDEFTVGFQREIAPELALSVSYISRRFRDQLQDIDVNHTLRLNPANGRPLDLFGQVQVLPDGTRIPVPDGRPDLYLVNPFFNQVLRIGNFNAARYSAIETQLTRRLSRRWQMQGSYTYSRAVGSAEDFQSRLGNDPSTIESEFGYLEYDQRHVVKVNAMAFLPRDWQVGSSMTWASGLPYSIISRFFALDNDGYQQFRTRYGYTVADPVVGARFVQLRRNSQRNAATLDVNVSLKRTFVIGRTAASASLEIFNLLNRDDLRIFTYEPNKGNFTSADLAQFLGPLQIDGERRFGRRLQVGLQMEF